MAMDTSTVRLVIFLGMFLVFAGDYTTVISAIFGNVNGKNDTITAKKLQGPPKDDQRVDKVMSDKLVFDDENGILRYHSFHLIYCDKKAGLCRFHIFGYRLISSRLNLE